MSFMLRTKTRDYDLGPTLEFLHFEEELAKLATHAKKEFPALFGLVDTNEETLSVAMRDGIAKEAEEALSLFEEKLSIHAKWVLGRLLGMRRKR